MLITKFGKIYHYCVEITDLQGLIREILGVAVGGQSSGQQLQGQQEGVSH